MKKSKIKKTEYVDKPSFRVYKRAIEKSSPEVRKHLYKLQKSQEEKYNKQEAEIKLGLKPSKSKEKVKRIQKNVGKIISKISRTQITSRKILKKDKTSYKIPDYNGESVWEDDNKFFKGALKNGMLN